MKPKVLLINLPFDTQNFYKQGYFSKTKQAPLFPFGIAYIASYLRSNNYEVEVLDIYANQLDNDKVLSKLRDFNYDVVGISALVTQYSYLKWLAPEIKKIKYVPIIIGNGLATACYQIVLDNIPEVDICVLGEGEQSTLEILQNIDDLREVGGIAYRNGNGNVKMNIGTPLKDIELLPAYDLFDMSLYTRAKIYETGLLDMRVKYADKPILSMLTSRGCPYSCNFCGKVIEHARLRKVNDVMCEIAYLVSHYNIQGVHFIDELFASSKARAIEFSKALKPMNLIWDCQARVNTMDLETMQIMKDAGCVAIGFGVESCSQKILDNMNKKTTVKQIEDAMLAAIKIHMPVKVQLIFGYPGENEDTIQETVDLFKRIGHPGRAMSAIIPILGTQLWEYAKSNGMVKDDELGLYNVMSGFSDNVSPIDFTEFDKEKVGVIGLISLRKKYDAIMEENYKQYLYHHPIRLCSDLVHYPSLRMPLLSHFMKRIKLYNVAKLFYHHFVRCPS